MINNKQPEIRFPGFTEDWEQRKLIQVAEYRNGRAHEQDIDLDGEYIVVNSKFVSTNGRVKKRTRNLIEPMNKGELAFVLSDIPNGKAIARTFLVDKDNKYSLNQRIAGISPNKDTDSYFLFILMNRNSYFLKFDNGVGQTNLSKSEVENFPELYPVYDEQQKIGSFFKHLDDTIVLHQQELTTLKQTKQGFLQKMFPKEGEQVPEIRFPEFNDDWEQHKVESMSEKTYGGGTPKTQIDEYWQGDFPWIQSSDLKIDELNNVNPQKFITEEAIKNSATKAIPEKSIAIVTRVGVGKLAYLNYSYSTSQDFLSLSKLTVDPFFGIYGLYRLIKKELNNIQGTSIKGMTKSDLLDKKLYIPNTTEEQQKIGAFFKTLDETITLHQRELDLLKETKKAFLQKMFV